MLKELMFVVMNRDDCTYKKEGNGDEKFCFKSSTNYATTCSAVVGLLRESLATSSIFLRKL